MALKEIPKDEVDLIKQILPSTFYPPETGRWGVKCGGQVVRLYSANRSDWGSKGLVKSALIKHLIWSTIITDALRKHRDKPNEYNGGTLAVDFAANRPYPYPDQKLVRKLVDDLIEQGYIEIVRVT